MIEVVHNAEEPTVLEPNDILLGHLDIFECHVSGARRLGVTGLDRLGLEAFRAFDKHHGYSTSSLATCANGSYEIVGCVPAGDPLLRTVDNIVLTIRALLGSCEHICNVGPSRWLRNCQADSLLALQNLRCHRLLHPTRTELEHGWQTNHHAGTHAINEPRCRQPCNLLVDDALVEVVELFRLHPAGQSWDKFQVLTWPNARCQESLLSHSVVNLLGRSGAGSFTPLRFITEPIQKFANLRTELLVGLRVVCRLPPHPEARLRVRDR
mmetsp:Transcript_31246/g.74839  ORF Transcript_31246/g.74839 Transcript_31246/m.74839 type:complete len:267 (-) Transcript_31246:328-1128(-)